MNGSYPSCNEYLECMLVVNGYYPPRPGRDTLPPPLLPPELEPELLPLLLLLLDELLEGGE